MITDSKPLSLAELANGKMRLNKFLHLPSNLAYMFHLLINTLVLSGLIIFYDSFRLEVNGELSTCENQIEIQTTTACS